MPCSLTPCFFCLQEDENGSVDEGAACGEEEAVDDSFMVEDGYLSDDEGLVNEGSTGKGEGGARRDAAGEASSTAECQVDRPRPHHGPYCTAPPKLPMQQFPGALFRPAA